MSAHDSLAESWYPLPESLSKEPQKVSSLNIFFTRIFFQNELEYVKPVASWDQNLLPEQALLHSWRRVSQGVAERGVARSKPRGTRGAIQLSSSFKGGNPK